MTQPSPAFYRLVLACAEHIAPASPKPLSIEDLRERDAIRARRASQGEGGAFMALIREARKELRRVEDRGEG